MKDQIAKIRSDLPRTIDEPIINRINIEGLPIVTYAASAPGMTVEQLSWFVDDTVARDLQSLQRRRRRSTASAASIAKSGSRSIRRSCWRSASPRRRSTSRCAQDNVDLGGGRGELAGQEQAIRTLAGAQQARRI